MFFRKHGLDSKNQSIYIIFPFFGGWDFPAVSTLERGKRRHANTIAIHEREAMSAEELINLQDSYTGAS